MQLHELRPFQSRRKHKRVGRGGKRGTYSGKGIKGQKSRAGRRFQPLIRQFIKKYPKLRGYRARRNKNFFAVLNVGIFQKKFPAGALVNPQVLAEKGIVAKRKGKVPRVKILGKGELSKSVIIENCEVSSSARKKIEKAGGRVK